MNHWLMKSEPSCFSIDDLERQKIALWDGVRNHQAKNFLKAMKPSDLAFFYHSSTKEPGIVGIMSIIGEPSLEDPLKPWIKVPVEFKEKWEAPLTLKMMKTDPSLEGFILLRPGLRLSVMPVSFDLWQRIFSLRGFG